MFEFIVIALEPFGSCKRVISCPAACTGTNMPDSAFAAINPSIVRNEYDGNHSNGTSIPPIMTSSLPTLNIFKYVFKFPFAFILKSDAVSELSCVVENKKGEKSVSKNSTSDY